MTILVVEDDPAILTLVDRLLTSRGHTVLAACDTSQASEVLREHAAAPDLLLTDLVLAGDSGLDYAKSMKAALSHAQSGVHDRMGPPGALGAAQRSRAYFAQTIHSAGVIRCRRKRVPRLITSVRWHRFRDVSWRKERNDEI